MKISFLKRILGILVFPALMFLIQCSDAQFEGIQNSSENDPEFDTQDIFARASNDHKYVKKYKSTCSSKDCHSSKKHKQSLPVSGKHTLHLQAGYECESCHYDYWDNPDHRNATVDTAPWKNIVSFDTGTFNAVWNYKDTSCSSVDCHNGTNTSPVNTMSSNTIFTRAFSTAAVSASADEKLFWYADSGGCLECHGPGGIGPDPTVTNGSGTQGKHIAHVTDRGLDCVLCHYSHITAHGAPMVDFSGFFYGTAVTASFNDTTKVCGSISCHAGTGGISWYAASVTCVQCHTSGSSIDPVTTNSSGASGKHVPHVTKKSLACEVCHKNYTAMPTHINTVYGKAETDIIVYFNDQNPSASWSDPDTTCSSMTCHGSISWYTTGGACNVCHDILNPGYGNAGSHPSHVGDGLIDRTGVNPDFYYGDLRIYKDYSQGVDAYIFGCGNCHPLDSASHKDGTVQVELYNLSAPSTTLKGKNTSTASYDSTAKTCADIYCHSSGQAESVRTYKTSPAWGTPYADTLTDPKCNKCHDNPPAYDSGGEGAVNANTHLVMGDDGWELGHFGGFPGPWHTSYHGHGNDWGVVASPITCQTCHYNTVDPANTGPSGYYYLDTTGNYKLSGGYLDFSCGEVNCHDGGTYNSIAPKKTGKSLPAKHVNGSKDVVFDPRTGQSPLPSGYSATTVGPLWVEASSGYLPPNSSYNSNIWSLNLSNSTYDTATKTCSDVPCHLRESYTGTGPGGTSYPALKWGRIPVGWASCDNCHRYY